MLSTVFKTKDRTFDVLFGLGIPKSVAVFTKQEFDEASDDISSLCYEVKNKEKILYART